MGLHAPNFQQTCPRHDINVNKISEYENNERNMNVIHHKDWYVRTENKIEKEDVTVCKSLSKVAVIFFIIYYHRAVCWFSHVTKQLLFY